MNGLMFLSLSAQEQADEEGWINSSSPCLFPVGEGLKSNATYSSGFLFRGSDFSRDSKRQNRG
jgi:hypothetical protein